MIIWKLYNMPYPLPLENEVSTTLAFNHDSLLSLRYYLFLSISSVKYICRIGGVLLHPFSILNKWSRKGIFICYYICSDRRKCRRPNTD